jgi:hypothetical protein
MRPCIGLLVLLVTPFCLTACWPDQKRQLSQCMLEETRLFPNGSLQEGETVVHLCMGAAGYEWDLDAEGCGPITWASVEAYNIHCYRPMSPFGEVAFKIEGLVIGHQ